MGSDPRHLVLPDGIVATGLPAVERTCKQIGIIFDLWQRKLNRAILAKDRHGFYAADTVAISIPRQVGKTFNIGALVFADAIINPGTTTVWTAHRFKVSRETFNELRAWAKSPLLAPHIDYDAITTGAGNETIPFRNGSRIVFAARERGAIRGFTKVRRLILDEAQILTEAAMSDLAPTMNQAVNPQIIMMGTPPKPSDPGEVFTQIRADALAGESESALYIEYAADADAPVDITAPGFWTQLAKANPSFPDRTDKRAIRRLRKLLTNDGDFLREVLGIWDTARTSEVFGDEGTWEKCRRPGGRPAGLEVDSLALACSLDLRQSSISAASRDGDAVWVKTLRHGPGTAWTLKDCKELQDTYGVDVVIDGKGPAAVLIPLLEREGVRLRIIGLPQVLDASAGFDQLVRDGLLQFEPEEELEDAVAGAGKRKVGDRWAWGRRQSSSEISPLEAGTFAVWAALNPEAAPGVSAYESRGVMSI